MNIDSTILYDNGIKREGIFISVCLSTYQVADMVCNALAAIFRQVAYDFELVISDDHSPDNTADVVLGWLRENDTLKFPVRFFQSCENKGIVENRLRGIAYAKGEWMLFADGDDYLFDGAVCKLADKLRVLEPRPSIVKVGNDDNVVHTDRYYPPGDPVYGRFPVGSNGYVISRKLFETFKNCWPIARIIADDPFFARRAMLCDGVWELAGQFYHVQYRRESASGGGVSGKNWIIDRKIRWEQLLRDMEFLYKKVPTVWRKQILKERRKMVLDAILIDCSILIWPFLWLAMLCLSPREARDALKKRVKLIVKGNVNSTWTKKV